MASVNIYLNFMGTTEEAFTFYRSVFGGEFTAFQRLGDMPRDPAHPLPENELDKVMYVQLPLAGGINLRGTDMLESLGHELRVGNNVTISLDFDDLDEARRVFDALSEGATELVPLRPEPWGAMWGVFLDRYQIRWMFNVWGAA